MLVTLSYRFYVFILLLFLGFGLLVARAETPLTAAAARDFIEGMMDEVDVILVDEALGREAYLHEAQRILSERLDTRIIGQFVLGVYWRSLDNQQRQQFVDTLQDYVVSLYGVRLRQRYDGEKIEVSGVSDGGGGTYIVDTLLVHPDDDEPIRLAWRLYQGKGKNIKIIDVVLEGISMVTTQRDEYAAVIRNNGGKIDVLVADLQNITTKLKHEFIALDSQ